MLWGESHWTVHLKECAFFRIDRVHYRLHLIRWAAHATIRRFDAYIMNVLIYYFNDIFVAFAYGIPGYFPFFTIPRMNVHEL